MVFASNARSQIYIPFCTFFMLFAEKNPSSQQIIYAVKKNLALIHAVKF